MFLPASFLSNFSSLLITVKSNIVIYGSIEDSINHHWRHERSKTWHENELLWSGKCYREERHKKIVKKRSKSDFT